LVYTRQHTVVEQTGNGIRTAVVKRSAERKEYSKMSLEYRSPAAWRGLPLIHIALGPRQAGDAARRARGVIAVGYTAQGLLAVGIVAIGIVAVGPVAVGVVSLGVVALGLSAAGVVAIGLVANGVVALGLLAVGVVALGLHAIGVVAGGNVVTPLR
jgi:hypothetical protein